MPCGASWTKQASPRLPTGYLCLVEASVELRTARLRDAWLDAVDELHEEVQRLRAGDVDAAQVIALLHVLEERAHVAFEHYRDVLLGR